jgi:hypothetical protein
VWPEQRVRRDRWRAARRSLHTSAFKSLWSFVFPETIHSESSKTKTDDAWRRSHGVPGNSCHVSPSDDHLYPQRIAKDSVGHIARGCLLSKGQLEALFDMCQGPYDFILISNEPDGRGRVLPCNSSSEMLRSLSDRLQRCCMPSVSCRLGSGSGSGIATPGKFAETIAVG